MSLPAILLLSCFATQPVAAAPTELEFDRALVDRLARAYAELGPVESLSLGGGATLGLGDVLASVRAYHPVLVSATARVRGAQGERVRQLSVKMETHMSVCFMWSGTWRDSESGCYWYLLVTSCPRRERDQK